MESMSDEKLIEVTGILLSERADGTKVLVVSSKAARREFAFSTTMWKKLAADAQWFNKKETE